jgi:hypothetical protein
MSTQAEVSNISAELTNSTPVLPLETTDDPLKEVPLYVPLAETIKAALAFSAVDARIVEELSLSCDELQSCLEESKKSKFRKPILEAQIISRRVTALKELAKAIDDIRIRENAGQEVQIIAMVIRLAKETMREVGVANDARELIIQSLAMKIEEEDARRRREARKS